MCAIVGIFNYPEAAKLAYLGLYAQQHRGQESAGIVSSVPDRFYIHHSMGLVADIFDEPTLNRLQGDSAIGHVRYSTHGESHIKNCQPFTVNYKHGRLAVAHNGNIVNAPQIKKDLEQVGAIFQSNMDTEVIVHLMASSKKESVVDRFKEALQKLEGAFSLVVMAEDQLLVARDVSGLRPLVIGKKEDGYIVASETCAFDLIEAEFIREVEPGEVIVINDQGLDSSRYVPEQKETHHCVFEYIYFARPDSRLFGREVYSIRKGYGKKLSESSSVEADLVIPVPDSGVPAAIGYAQAAQIPFELGLIRNHYVGRTFIEPEQNIRHFGVKVKLNPVKDSLKGKRVILVDDSIVRGTTSQKIVKMVRDAGATEVHMRISSPPTSWPCFYGIDTPSRKELISAQKSVAEIQEYIGADSLEYLSQDDLYWFDPKANSDKTYCDACFTGNYPVGQKSVQKNLDFEV